MPRLPRLSGWRTSSSACSTRSAATFSHHHCVPRGRRSPRRASPPDHADAPSQVIWAATQGPEVGTPFPQIFISTFPQYGILVYMSLSVLLKLKYDIDLKEKVGGSDWVGCVIFTAGFLAWAFVVHKHLQTKVFAQVNPRRAIGSYRSPRAPLTLRAPLRRSSSPARSEPSRRSTARARRLGARLRVDDARQ